jgi:predicted ATPase
MERDYLYIDNFRGFSKTIIPIKRVNFFVGENSTGKSSILAIMRIFEDVNAFWFTSEPSFSSKDPDFSNFNDVVSIGSEDRRYFNAGLLRLRDNKGGVYGQGFFATFKNREGLPFIRRYTYMNKGKQIDFKIGDRHVSFKRQDAKRIEGCDVEQAEKVFNDWSDLHIKGGNHYKVIPEGKIPRFLAVLNSILEFGLQKEEDIGERLKHFQVFNIFGGNAKWLSPIRSRPRKTYDLYRMQFSPEGEHTPYMIKKFFNKAKKKKSFLEFIKIYGENSGLFEEVSVKNFGGGGLSSPFELDITIKGVKLKITDVGYGVSQVLPIIVEIFEGSAGEGYLIQQPEIRLHPRAQAALGDIIYRAAAYGKMKFVIETHSDFIIDRFRTSCRDDSEKQRDFDSQVVFFERSERGNIAKVIQINDEGQLSEDQPKGYREFFLREEMKVLGFK